MNRAMKSLLYFFLVISVGLLQSCGSDSDDSNNPLSQGTMTATVDGVSYTATSVVGGTFGVFNVTGSELKGSTTNTISISLPNLTGTGPIEIDGFLSGIAAYYTGNPNSVDYFNNGFTASSGTVNITEFTATKVSGTFSFVATSGTTTLNVTNGAFSLNLSN